jgi:YHS domain-containing protein
VVLDTGDEMMEKDVVCGMNVDPKTAAATSEYKGRMYYFCSKGCKAQFDQNPEKFVGSEHAQHAHH